MTSVGWKSDGLKEIPLVKDAQSQLPRNLEHDPRFLRRVEQARSSLRAGQGVNLEDLEIE
jgi:hypothetical protein